MLGSKLADSVHRGRVALCWRKYTYNIDTAIPGNSNHGLEVTEIDTCGQTPKRQLRASKDEETAALEPTDGNGRRLEYV